MDKKIKDYIATNKLSDADIYKLLTAEPTPAEEEEEEETDEESDVEDANHEEGADVEEDATPEQPDVRAIIKEILAEELGKMKRGKKPPKTTKKVKKKPKATYNYNQEFGVI